MQPGFEKRFNPGDIVYWCRNEGNGMYSVAYGMVDEQFSDAVVIDFLAFRELRRINGIPISEFESETRYKKLPKGWTYNTNLFEVTWDDFTPEEKAFKLNLKDPVSIKAAYERGLLVKDRTLFHGQIEEDITKDGYRIVLRYPMWKHHIDHTSVRPDLVYFTYEEAENELIANIAEFTRQANLSDYEWSLEQIDKTIDRWRAVNDVSQEEADKYREWFRGMSNIEDIETRIFGGNVQWKYWKNKKWNYVEL